MNMDPILAAPLLIQIHLATALIGVGAGAVQVAGVRLGRAVHRVLGWTFVSAMLATSAAAFFIRDADGQMSWIHIFVPITVLSVLAGTAAILSGDVRAHRATMRSFYFGGLLVAGAFTFFPGRILHAAVFG